MRVRVLRRPGTTWVEIVRYCFDVIPDNRSVSLARHTRLPGTQWQERRRQLASRSLSFVVGPGLVPKLLGRATSAPG